METSLAAVEGVKRLLAQKLTTRSEGQPAVVTRPLRKVNNDRRRISVSSSMVFGSVVRHAEPPNGRFGPYVFRILRMDEWDGSECDPRIDAPGQPRALVSWSGAEAGRQGVARGDVVTHVDGVPFSGTAAELAEVLKGAAARGGERQGEPLHLVFNADRAVAEVLRRRAAVLENGQGSS